MRFLGRQNGLKYVLGSQRSPDLLTALRGPTCKGREHRGKKQMERDGTGGEGKSEGSCEGREIRKRGPE